MKINPAKPMLHAHLVDVAVPYHSSGHRRHTYARDLNGPWLLFDNQADPCQMNNLVNKPEHAKLQKEMEAILTRKLKETNDDFLPGPDYIKKWGYKVDASETVPYTD